MQSISKEEERERDSVFVVKINFDILINHCLTIRYFIFRYYFNMKNITINVSETFYGGS